MSLRRVLRPFSTLLALAAFLPLVACSGGYAPTPSAPIEWPELTRLEELLAELTPLVESGKTAETLLKRNLLLEVGWAVNHRTIPPNALHDEEVRLLLGDLVGKVNRLAVPALDEGTLREVVQGMNPIVAEIAKTSGVGTRPSGQ